MNKSIEAIVSSWDEQTQRLLLTVLYRRLVILTHTMSQQDVVDSVAVYRALVTTAERGVRR